jgi:hypothetical protein
MKIKHYYLCFPLLALLLLLPLLKVSAQVTEGFNYQAVARDAVGEILPNTDIELQMIVAINPDGSGAVYQETHFVSSDAFGMVNVVIGEGTPNVGIFNEINWDDSAHYLSIRMNFDGTDAVLPPVQFQAVPYAKVAATTSDKLWQETGASDMSIYYNNGPVGIGTLEPQRKLEVARSFEDTYLRIHSQGSPAGAAMIELVRGSAFSATDWRIGNTGSGFTFERDNDNFIDDFAPTAFFISNSGLFGFNDPSPMHTLDISGGNDYNTVRIRGFLDQILGERIPAVQFTYKGILEPIIPAADFRLVNNGTSFRLERSNNDFEQSSETMWSVKDDTGNLNLHFHRIVDMADPTQGDHAVTLSYMNSAIDEALTALSTGPIEISSPSQSTMFMGNCAIYCRAITEGGHDDWRIPTIEELTFFFDNDYPFEYVWSRTPSPNSFTGAGNDQIYRYYVYNLSAASVSHELQEQLRCRCVRGEGGTN